MSVTVRLTRTGRKNLPSFRIVASNTKDKRDGRFLDVIGYYNPSEGKAKFDYNKERLEYWKKNGALISKAVSDLVEGKYTFKPYKPTKQETKTLETKTKE